MGQFLSPVISLLFPKAAKACRLMELQWGWFLAKAEN